MDLNIVINMWGIEKTCIDASIHCKKCGKLVRRAIYNVEDFISCELNHVYCMECKNKFKLENCPECKLPLKYEELKNPYFIQG